MGKSAIFLYIGMFAASAVGLWGVLALGSRLEAPHDLSGEWYAEPGPGQEAADRPALTVSQSGRFVRVRVRRRGDMELRWAGEQADPATGGRVIRLADRADPPQAVTVRVPADPASGAYVFERSGSESAVWRVRRRPAGATGAG